jgi:hypothetical protein
VQHALCCTHCFEQSAQQTAWRATENKRYMRTCEGHLHFAARCRCQKPCNGAPTVCSAGERVRADRYLQQTWVPTRSGAITTLVALASRALSTSSANADPQVCRRERSLINLNRTVYCRLRQPRTAYPRAHCGETLTSVAEALCAGLSVSFTATIRALSTMNTGSSG